MNNFILFDVGANWGTDSLDRARLDLGTEVWAFEPVPEMCNHLKNSSQSFSNRYHVEQIALSDYNGTTVFNVHGVTGTDWGCSSLIDFNDNLNQSWPGRTEFKYTDTIPVQVSRFDTWFEHAQPNIDRIDYFHCDVQGTDLKVLQGMGKYLSLIRSGVVECACNDHTRKLYKESHTVQEMVGFLESNNFSIVDVISNDRTNNEFNVYFKQLVK